MEAQGPFQEAERQYHWYTNEWQAGRLDLQSYRNAINGLEVTDSQGRLWMLQEGSGQWHVWQGNRWEPGVPYQPAAPASPPPPARVSPTFQAAPPPTDAGSGGFLGKLILYWLGILFLFGVIGIALLVFVSDFGPEGLPGVGLAALISMVLTTVILSKRWEGRIVELRQERVRVSGSSDDESDHYEYHTFAYLLQPSGKTRKERAMPGWDVGDYVRKERGKMSAEKVISPQS